jgi:hypothetical protein
VDLVRFEISALSRTSCRYIVSLRAAFAARRTSNQFARTCTGGKYSTRLHPLGTNPAAQIGLLRHAETHSGISSAAHSSQVAGHRPLRNLQAELQFNSSPWILGATHVGFSPAMRRMSWRSSELTPGLPAARRESQRQYSRKPARCQPTTVSGFTMTSTSAHCDYICRSVAQYSRSHRPSLGRGFLGLSTFADAKLRAQIRDRAASERTW